MVARWTTRSVSAPTDMQNFCRNGGRSGPSRTIVCESLPPFCLQQPSSNHSATIEYCVMAGYFHNRVGTARRPKTTELQKAPYKIIKCELCLMRYCAGHVAEPSNSWESGPPAIPTLRGLRRKRRHPFYARLRFEPRRRLTLHDS